MSLLLLRGTTVNPTLVKKGRKELASLVRSAPTGARTLDWWLRWLIANWR